MDTIRALLADCKLEAVAHKNSEMPEDGVREEHGRRHRQGAPLFEAAKRHNSTSPL